MGIGRMVRRLALSLAVGAGLWTLGALPWDEVLPVSGPLVSLGARPAAATANTAESLCSYVPAPNNVCVNDSGSGWERIRVGGQVRIRARTCRNDDVGDTCSNASSPVASVLDDSELPGGNNGWFWLQWDRDGPAANGSTVHYEQNIQLTNTVNDGTVWEWTTSYSTTGAVMPGVRLCSNDKTACDSWTSTATAAFYVFPNATPTIDVHVWQPNHDPLGALSCDGSGGNDGTPNTQFTFSTFVSDPEADQVAVYWDFDGNGTYDKRTPASGYGTHGTITETWTFGREVHVVPKAYVVDDHGASSGWDWYTCLGADIYLDVPDDDPSVTMNYWSPNGGALGGRDGRPGTTFTFTATGSDDYGIAEYQWDLNGDCVYNAGDSNSCIDRKTTTPSTTWTYNASVSVVPRVRAKDISGQYSQGHNEACATPPFFLCSQFGDSYDVVPNVPISLDTSVEVPTADMQCWSPAGNDGFVCGAGRDGRPGTTFTFSAAYADADRGSPLGGQVVRVQWDFNGDCPAGAAESHSCVERTTDISDSDGEGTATTTYSYGASGGRVPQVRFKDNDGAYSGWDAHSHVACLGPCSLDTSVADPTADMQCWSPAGNDGGVCGAGRDGRPGTTFTFSAAYADPDRGSPLGGQVVRVQWDFNGDCPAGAAESHSCVERTTDISDSDGEGTATTTYSYGASGGRVPQVRFKDNDGAYSVWDAHGHLACLGPCSLDTSGPDASMQWWEPCFEVAGLCAPSAGLADGFVGEPFTLHADFSDPDAGQGRRVTALEWDADGNGTVDSTTAVSPGQASGSASSPAVVYASAGTRYPQVRAVGDDGSVGAWDRFEPDPLEQIQEPLEVSDDLYVKAEMDCWSPASSDFGMPCGDTLAGFPARDVRMGGAVTLAAHVTTCSLGVLCPAAGYTHVGSGLSLAGYDVRWELNGPSAGPATAVLAGRQGQGTFTVVFPAGYSALGAYRPTVRICNPAQTTCTPPDEYSHGPLGLQVPVDLDVYGPETDMAWWDPCFQEPGGGCFDDPLGLLNGGDGSPRTPFTFHAGYSDPDGVGVTKLEWDADGDCADGVAVGAGCVEAVSNGPSGGAAASPAYVYGVEGRFVPKARAVAADGAVGPWDTLDLTLLGIEPRVDVVAPWVRLSMNCWDPHDTVTVVGIDIPCADRLELPGVANRDARTLGPVTLRATVESTYVCSGYLITWVCDTLLGYEKVDLDAADYEMEWRLDATAAVGAQTTPETTTGARQATFPAGYPHPGEFRPEVRACAVGATADCTAWDRFNVLDLFPGGVVPEGVSDVIGIGEPDLDVYGPDADMDWWDPCFEDPLLGQCFHDPAGVLPSPDGTRGTPFGLDAGFSDPDGVGVTGVEWDFTGDCADDYTLGHACVEQAGALGGGSSAGTASSQPRAYGTTGEFVPRVRFVAADGAFGAWDTLNELLWEPRLDVVVPWVKVQMGCWDPHETVSVPVLGDFPCADRPDPDVPDPLDVFFARDARVNNGVTLAADVSTSLLCEGTVAGFVCDTLLGYERVDVDLTDYELQWRLDGTAAVGAQTTPETTTGARQATFPAGYPYPAGFKPEVRACAVGGSPCTAWDRFAVFDSVVPEGLGDYVALGESDLDAYGPEADMQDTDPGFGTDSWPDTEVTFTANYDEPDETGGVFVNEVGWDFDGDCTDTAPWDDPCVERTEAVVTGGMESVTTEHVYYEEGSFRPQVRFRSSDSAVGKWDVYRSPLCADEITMECDLVLDARPAEVTLSGWSPNRGLGWGLLDPFDARPDEAVTFSASGYGKRAGTEFLWDLDGDCPAPADPGADPPVGCVDAVTTYPEDTVTYVYGQPLQAVPRVKVRASTWGDNRSFFNGYSRHEEDGAFVFGDARDSFLGFAGGATITIAWDDAVSMAPWSGSRPDVVNWAMERALPEVEALFDLDFGIDFTVMDLLERALTDPTLGRRLLRLAVAYYDDPEAFKDQYRLQTRPAGVTPPTLTDVLFGEAALPVVKGRVTLSNFVDLALGLLLAPDPVDGTNLLCDELLPGLCDGVTALFRETVCPLVTHPVIDNALTPRLAEVLGGLGDVFGLRVLGYTSSSLVDAVLPLVQSTCARVAAGGRLDDLVLNAISYPTVSQIGLRVAQTAAEMVLPADVAGLLQSGIRLTDVVLVQLPPQLWDVVEEVTADEDLVELPDRALAMVFDAAQDAMFELVAFVDAHRGDLVALRDRLGEVCGATCTDVLDVALQVLDTTNTLVQLVQTFPVADATGGARVVFRVEGPWAGEPIPPTGKAVLRYEWDVDGDCPAFAGDGHPCIDAVTTAADGVGGTVLDHRLPGAGSYTPRVRAHFSDETHSSHNDAGLPVPIVDVPGVGGSIDLTPRFGDGQDVFGFGNTLQITQLEAITPKPVAAMTWWDPCPKLFGLFCWGARGDQPPGDDVTFGAHYRDPDGAHGDTVTTVEWDLDGDGAPDRTGAVTPAHDLSDGTLDDAGTVALTLTQAELATLGTGGADLEPQVRFLTGDGTTGAWDRLLDPTCLPDFECGLPLDAPEAELAWSPRGLFDLFGPDGDTATPFTFQVDWEPAPPKAVREYRWDVDGDGDTDVTTAATSRATMQASPAELGIAAGVYVPAVTVLYTDDTTGGPFRARELFSGEPAALDVDAACVDTDTDGVPCAYDGDPASSTTQPLERVTGGGAVLMNSTSMDAALFAALDIRERNFFGQRIPLGPFTFANTDLLPSPQLSDAVVGLWVTKAVATTPDSAYVTGLGLCLKYDETVPLFRARIGFCDWHLRIDDDTPLTGLGRTESPIVDDLLDLLVPDLHVDAVRVDAAFGTNRIHYRGQAVPLLSVGVEVVPRAP